MNVSINPSILRWARERVGHTLESLALKMHRDVEQIARWENGDEDIPYTGLEELAYSHLKIPIALFFFPEPPDLEDPINRFRRIPDSEIERFSPDTFYVIQNV